MSNTKYVTGVTVYNINCDDDIIYVDTSASPVSIVLPNIQNSGITLLTNKTFTINDYTNNASVNNIAIVASGNSVNSGQTTAINSNNGTAFATIVGVNSWQVTTDNPITNGLTYMGTWNATTNDPTLVSSVGIGGQYYIVSVAGTTNLNGTTDWNVGDWAIFIDGTTNVWQKVDNHEIQSYNFIQDEGVALPQQSVIDFQGGGVTASNGVGKTIVTIPASTSYGLYAQTALGTNITNTIVETSLVGAGVGTLTVPPNAFKVGDSFTAKMCGNLSCANAETIHIRVKSDGDIIADAGVFEMKISTNKYFELLLEFTITKIGGAGVAELFVNGQYSYNQNAGSNLEGTNFASISNTTFNTTIANALSITAQWGSAKAANSIQSQNFVLQKTF